jgi:hypothetical protein
LRRLVIIQMFWFVHIIILNMCESRCQLCTVALAIYNMHLLILIHQQ